ncbi:MAG TPA: glycosyltransferase family 2 protein [Blastocatellia bacterium]|nr:glycosyltransferase family 2 protein [Blastocatellia bacterium]HMV83429.1 glycosyltransferase family 2 protein [Blastocatellia bacterium]HMX24098.1 glycosyltransferase family 2 protein [Blastocatellia bacterium]HMY72063.1 glycosyltransferase family 2 protein [Blastocatellia bacterium]HMZ16685.1 glycosyltransferase family 2 protein [Blastocatellia bacterium]
MNLPSFLFLQAQSPEQVKVLIDPIMRHGRDNISYLSSMDSFDLAIVILYFTILGLLAILGIYRVRMVWQFWRYRNIKPQPKRRFAEAELPRITVQLPLFNELYVVERLVESVVKLDYPRHLLEIQVLDDSTDETVGIAAAVVERFKQQGFDISYIHRTDRTGFKAGALEKGMKVAKGELMAIFDADFTPNADTLRKMVDFFSDEKVGMVQMRWGHINANFSLLTRIQEVLLDGHFVVEQTSRNRTGAFFNFNGTAGMWRREAIEYSGGWQHDTLTEDTDLSFRAQLMGWKFVYLLDEEVPAELPVEMNAFKAQQRRWAKGLVQVGLKLMPRIWHHPELTLQQKVELFFRLFGNCAAMLMIVLSILHIPVLIVRFNQGMFHMLLFDTPLMIFATFSVVSFYGTAILYRFPNEKRRLWLIPLAMAMGIGLVFSNARAVLEALFGVQSSFVRTPKYNVASGKDNWLQVAKKYKRKGGWLPFLELAFALYFVGAVYYAIRTNIYATIPFLLIFLLGYGYMAMMSLFQGRVRKLLNTFRRS